MESVLSQIKKEIDFFCKNLPQEPCELYEPMKYMLSLGGKNIRPLMLLLTCKMFKGQIKDALPAALAIELFHNFTLIHDDISDNSPLRRNSPTVHAKWNTNIALLSGDALLIKSYEQLSKVPSKYFPAVLQVFNESAIEVCEGQQYDMNYEKQANVTMNDYLEMIRMKTAALFSASMEIGAIVAGASPADCKKMKVAGENIGMVFQLKDDALDIFGNSAKTGKQAGGDIIQGKKTFLFLKAMELSGGKTNKKELYSLMENTGVSPSEKVQKVKTIYENLKIENHVNKQMELYYTRAKKAIDSLSIQPPGMNISEKEILLNLAANLLNREV